MRPVCRWRLGRSSVGRRVVRRLLRLVVNSQILDDVVPTSDGRSRKRTERRHGLGGLSRQRTTVRRRQLQLRLEDTRRRSARRQVHARRNYN